MKYGQLQHVTVGCGLGQSVLCRPTIAVYHRLVRLRCNRDCQTSSPSMTSLSSRRTTQMTVTTQLNTDDNNATRKQVPTKPSWQNTRPLALSSSRIQMDALGHTLMPFCSVCCQFSGFIPRDVHVLQISSDDVHPILHRTSQLSLVAPQFPPSSLTRYSGVLHS